MVFKKIALMATLALAAMSVAASAASANWLHEGEPLGPEDTPQITLEGSASFSGETGGVSCHGGVTAVIEATGGTTDGHVKSFTVHNPTTCHVSGLLQLLAGGTNSLHKVELTGEPTVTINNGKLEITGVTLHNTFANLELTLSSASSPLVGTPESASSISSVSVTGPLNTSIGTSVTATLDLDVIGGDAGTYGISS